MVNGSRFTHRADTHSLPKAGQCEGGHLFIGKLIQEGIPSRIVIVIFQHVYKLQVGFFAHLRELHTGGIRQIRVIQHHVCCQHIRHGKLYKTRCNGAFPVTAGIINDCIISLAFIAVHVCGSKKRGYFSTRAVGCGIGLGIKALIKRINQISISFRSHTVFCSVAFRSKNVVCSLMGVFRRSEIIGPILQNIGAGAKCIIRCEEVFRHSNCKCFALTRLKNLRFVVSDQFYRSLFDLILSVIIRIGFLCIDLDGLLTCCRARVGNRDSHGVRSIFAISLSGNRNIREVKGRVAEPVAEREGHHTVVIILSDIRCAHHNVFIAGLRIFISEVNALLINHILAICRECAEIVTINSIIKIGTEIVHHGVQLIVHPPGIRQRTGWIDRTADHVTHSIEACLPDRAHPECCIHSVIFFK